MARLQVGYAHSKVKKMTKPDALCRECSGSGEITLRHPETSAGDALVKCPSCSKTDAIERLRELVDEVPHLPQRRGGKG